MPCPWKFLYGYDRDICKQRYIYTPMGHYEDENNEKFLLHLSTRTRPNKEAARSKIDLLLDNIMQKNRKD